METGVETAALVAQGEVVQHTKVAGPEPQRSLVQGLCARCIALVAHSCEQCRTQHDNSRTRF
jgi:hypothetical protein